MAERRGIQSGPAIRAPGPKTTRRPPGGPGPTRACRAATIRAGTARSCRFRHPARAGRHRRLIAPSPWPTARGRSRQRAPRCRRSRCSRCAPASGSPSSCPGRPCRNRTVRGSAYDAASAAASASGVRLHRRVDLGEEPVERRARYGRGEPRDAEQREEREEASKKNRAATSCGLDQRVKSTPRPASPTTPREIGRALPSRPRVVRVGRHDALEEHADRRHVCSG